MTKFGKHPGLDTVDLGFEVPSNALADGGMTMRQMGVPAAGCVTDFGPAVGVEKLSGRGMLAGGTRAADADTRTPSGRHHPRGRDAGV